MQSPEPDRVCAPRASYRELLTPRPGDQVNVFFFSFDQTPTPLFVVFAATADDREEGQGQNEASFYLTTSTCFPPCQLNPSPVAALPLIPNSCANRRHGELPEAGESRRGYVAAVNHPLCPCSCAVAMNVYFFASFSLQHSMHPPYALPLC